MTNNYQKLQKVLTEIFQLDKAELDFGIYRIMNQKRNDVEEFLTEKLPSQVRTILEQNNNGDTAELQKELDKTLNLLKDAGVDPYSSPKVKELKSKIENGTSIDALEQDVFSHLASFFKRYYQGGDFISLRRYKKDVYAIPYEGEEVKLHWANHDQYYIKTSEYLKNYAFKLPGNRTVKFELKEASTEQNNNKAQKDKERRFALYEEAPVVVDEDTLIIYFTYEPQKNSVKQDSLIEKAITKLSGNIPSEFQEVFTLKPTEKNKKRTLLEKHINDYTARNSFDYFIHKDLGGFLRRELDFYIKNEVLFIDDINTDDEIAFAGQIYRIKALKQVASKIIQFLEQLENFQKKLWLKKKIVVKSDYCITVDRIPEDYYKEILENKAQLKEWNKLFKVKIQDGDNLKKEPFLVLDTKFFSNDFKDKLINEVENIQSETNGILINSENFQGLQLLAKTYNKEINQIYIDPPYNTESNEIIYKNGFKHSSWLSLMNDRLSISDKLQKTEGVLNIAIDSAEQKELGVLLKNKYEHSKEVHAIPVIHNPRGIQGKNISYLHEYLYYVYDKDEDKLSEIDIPQEEWDYSNLRNWGGESEREYGKTLFYPVTVDIKEEKIIEIGEPEPESSHPKANEFINTNVLKIYPIDSNGVERKWRYSIKRLKKEQNLIRIGKEKGGNYKLEVPKTSSRIKSIWTDKIFDASIYGKQLISNILPEGEFSFPKSIYNVLETLKSYSKNIPDAKILDYFAGSGTTGHATIKMNREDGGRRKYLMVEMGEYFNSVTKPRIQKVIYSDNWKDGKPQDKKGISQMFKYMVLESYEDALNNLVLQKSSSQQDLLSGNEAINEEYLLQYILDVESRGHLFNLEAFKNPFNYQLKVTANNELIPTTVDLVETFNYLIGLHVKRIQRIGAYKTVEGTTNKGEKVLVIWRNLEETINEDLERFIRKADINVLDGEFDTIYVNGDNNLANFRKDEDTWKVLLTEETFFLEMFDVKDV